MRITILTLGIRGDVQPYIALGLGLKNAGYQVTLACNPEPADFVAEHGLDTALLHAGFHQYFETEEGIKFARGDLGSMYRGITDTLHPIVRRLLDDSWEAAQGSDALIYHPDIPAGYHIAEKLDIPCFLASPLPSIVPTGAFPHPYASGLRLGAAANRLSYVLNRLPRALLHFTINRWRRQTLGLPSRSFFAANTTLHDKPIPVLYAFSPSAISLPLPRASHVHITGFWLLPASPSWSPPADLTEFIELGPPPIYVGFGNKTIPDRDRLTGIVFSALERLRVRCVITAGWDTLPNTYQPPTLYRARDVPARWLFPRMAAIVNHGDAATVAGSLRAGRPTVVCPFFRDEPFWGKVVWNCGVGPEPIPIGSFTATRLADAISKALSDTTIQERARHLGNQIRAEDGVQNAVAVIRQYLDTGSADN
jgi:sterol 3beta-glucosyltransferase